MWEALRGERKSEGRSVPNKEAPLWLERGYSRVTQRHVFDERGVMVSSPDLSPYYHLLCFVLRDKTEKV